TTVAVGRSRRLRLAPYPLRLQCHRHDATLPAAPLPTAAPVRLPGRRRPAGLRETGVDPHVRAGAAHAADGGLRGRGGGTVVRGPAARVAAAAGYDRTAIARGPWPRRARGGPHGGHRLSRPDGAADRHGHR